MLTYIYTDLQSIREISADALGHRYLWGLSVKWSRKLLNGRMNTEEVEWCAHPHFYDWIQCKWNLSQQIKVVVEGDDGALLRETIQPHSEQKLLRLFSFLSVTAAKLAFPMRKVVDS